MRIAMITPGFCASPDDWCIPVLRNLATGLAADHEVEVYSAAYPPSASTYDVGGVRVHAFGSGARGYAARIGEMRRVAAAVRSAHRGRPFDVLHGFWADQGGVISSYLGRRLGVPSLLTVMAGELSYEPAVAYGKRGRIGGFAGKWAARRATAVNVISEYHRRRLAAEQRGLRCTVYLPFGVDTALFNPRAPPAAFSEGVNVVMVGSLGAVKGHATALRALRTVAGAHPSVHLHVLGDGALRRPLAEMAGRLGVGAHVTFHGHVPHDALPAYYRGAAFCLLCSHFESSGLVVLEAAACGRVTVGSAVGSLAEIVPAELLVEPGDAAGLAALMVRLIERPRETARLGERVMDRVAEEFSARSMIERYARAYRRLAENGAVF